MKLKRYIILGLICFNIFFVFTEEVLKTNNNKQNSWSFGTGISLEGVLTKIDQSSKNYLIPLIGVNIHVHTPWWEHFAIKGAFFSVFSTQNDLFTPTLGIKIAPMGGNYIKNTPLRYYGGGGLLLSTTATKTSKIGIGGFGLCGMELYISKKVAVPVIFFEGELGAYTSFQQVKSDVNNKTVKAFESAGSVTYFQGTLGIRWVLSE